MTDTIAIERTYPASTRCTTRSWTQRLVAGRENELDDLAKLLR